MESKIEKPFFSIIVPVYNVENYLEKCVQSVLIQSFKDFELILVNDGSTDQSGKICDQLALYDNRITIIHKTNGGLSDARNYGIKVSKGVYIIFLDSDDYWDNSSALYSIKQTITNNTDVLFYGCKDYDSRTHLLKISRNNYDENIINKGNKAEIIHYLVKTGLYPGSAWLTVTNRNFILNNQLYFLKGYNSEDIDWLFSIFCKAKTFNVLNLPFYIYVKNRNGSITNSVKRKTIEDLIYIISKWSKIFHEKPSLYTKSLLAQLNHCYMMLLICYAQLNNNDKVLVINKIISEKRLLKYAIHTKYKLSAHIIQIFGVNWGSKLLYLAYKVQH